VVEPDPKEFQRLKNEYRRKEKRAIMLMEQGNYGNKEILMRSHNEIPLNLAKSQ